MLQAVGTQSWVGLVGVRIFALEFELHEVVAGEVSVGEHGSLAF